MSKVSLLLLLICSVLAFVHGQKKFNAFKSYATAKERPIMYAKKSTHHAVSEYLTELQIKMLNARTGKDTADVMFDNKWSGFNGFQPAPISGVKRKLGDFEERVAERNSVDSSSSFVVPYVLLGATALVAGSALWYFKSQKASKMDSSDVV